MFTKVFKLHIENCKDMALPHRTLIFYVKPHGPSPDTRKLHNNEKEGQHEEKFLRHGPLGEECGKLEDT